MIRKILIANRGEIALRILRATKALDKQAVGIYTKVDKSLLHLRYADDVVCIGERDYLSPRDIVMAAKLQGCDAVHPGYGFLSEDPEFAALVETEGLVFIGPEAKLMVQLGDKAAAKTCFAALGLKPVPGSTDSIESLAQAQAIAADIGYPVVVKASFGGGGRGIRVVSDDSALAAVYEIAIAEALANFGQSDIYLEKYLLNARHIEVQLMGDGQGKVIHLGSRDCSMQRRHQKVIEEAPASQVAPDLIQQLCHGAISALSALSYRNAATLEFLVADGQWYFLEINTRLQVEHTVTEMLTGQDLVQLQIRLAEGQTLPAQKHISFQGHAVQCRINAEDASFNPCPGTVTGLILPGGPGVRVDTHLYTGYRVPHEYDSLVAKLISHGEDRDQALSRMSQALAEFEIEGIETNLPMLRRLVKSEAFATGEFDTQTLENSLG